MPLVDQPAGPPRVTRPSARHRGRKLSVTGTVLSGFWRWPFTVRTTPPGLPSRMSTAFFSVQVREEPAGITPMKSCAPSPGLVSRTQQSSVAVSSITTLCVVGVGDGCAVGLALAVALCVGAAADLDPEPPASCDTSRYAPNPM